MNLEIKNFNSLVDLITKDFGCSRPSNRIFIENREDDVYMYLAKNPIENETELRRMVSEAAKRANYVVEAWRGENESRHGMETKNTFYLGPAGAIFVSPKKEFAEEFKTKGTWEDGASGRNGRIYHLYISPRRTGVLKDTKLLNYVLGLHKSAKSFVFAKQEVPEKFKKFLDYDSFRTEDNSEYALTRPSQIKSADVVTYDDDMNIIPISQRFDSAKNDIRY